MTEYKPSDLDDAIDACLEYIVSHPDELPAELRPFSAADRALIWSAAWARFEGAVASRARAIEAYDRAVDDKLAAADARAQGLEP